MSQSTPLGAGSAVAIGSNAAIYGLEFSAPETVSGKPYHSLHLFFRRVMVLRAVLDRNSSHSATRFNLLL